MPKPRELVSIERDLVRVPATIDRSQKERYDALAESSKLGKSEFYRIAVLVGASTLERLLVPEAFMTPEVIAAAMAQLPGIQAEGLLDLMGKAALKEE